MGRRAPVAIIDLGSNSFRLVVFRFTPGDAWEVVDEIREPVRIGAGMGADAVLQERPVARALDAVQGFAAFCARMGIDDVVAAGTSALRRAANGPASSSGWRAAGLPVRVLDEAEEAHYGGQAILHSTSLGDGFGLDMGGGSIQLIAFEDHAIARSASFPLGAVRVTEDHLPDERARPEQLDGLRAAVAGQLETTPWWGRPKRRPLAAIGGSVRNLATAAQRLEGVPNGGVQGYRCVGRSSRRSWRSSPRATPPSAGGSRASTPTGGRHPRAAVVLETVMRCGRFDVLEVTEAGLREGLFFERWLEGRPDGGPEDVRAASVANLLARVRADPERAEHVALLALALYDGLADAGPGTPTRTSAGSLAARRACTTSAGRRLRPASQARAEPDPSATACPGSPAAKRCSSR